MIEDDGWGLVVLENRGIPSLTIFRDIVVIVLEEIVSFIVHNSTLRVQHRQFSFQF